MMTNTTNSSIKLKPWLRRWVWVVVMGIGLGWGQLAAAPMVQLPQATVRLISDHQRIALGQDFRVGLAVELKPGWHLYWKNPGDSGLAPKLSWTLPPQLSLDGPLYWPPPQRFLTSGISSYGYSESLRLEQPLRLNQASDKVLIQLQADLYLCREVCIPEQVQLSLELATAATATAVDSWTRPWVAPLAVDVHSRGSRLLLSWPDTTAPPSQGHFFADTAQLTEAGQHRLSQLEGRWQLEVPLLKPYPNGQRLTGYLQLGEGAAASLYRIDAPLSAPDWLGLLGLMALGFVGGLILNVMPCVLPVLVIKLVGVIDIAHGDSRIRRRHGLWFLLGVLLCFALLGGLMLLLRSGGQAVGWGFQLQSPSFVALLAVFFALFSWHLASSNSALGQGLMRLAGAVKLPAGPLAPMLDGLLISFVATPCSAPFMGVAIGSAIQLPPLPALAIFLALGAGLGLPYAAICAWPRLERYIPRPGPWMEQLKQLLAIPLAATVLWLADVWLSLMGFSQLTPVVVVLSLALWAWFGLWLLQQVQRRSLLALGLALWLTVGLGLVTEKILPQHTTDIPWSSQRLAQLRQEQKTVLLVFTAKWCITCQLNERLILRTDAVQQALARHRVSVLVADWTQSDPKITAQLASFGRNSIPLYVLYPQGGEAQLLPEPLTTEGLIGALRGQ